MNPPPARRLGVSFDSPTASFAGGRLLTPALLLPTPSGAVPSSSGTEARGIRLGAVVIKNGNTEGVKEHPPPGWKFMEV